ncbi:MAG: hypothetical protein EAZ67_13125 [Cytophagales bacterium]|nr:MAG: hypothetical protein EAZ67_13125 [Cytophagales bacterium]
MLAFRLNGSNKVSVIYSTSQTIFAKTLRRHWFQRTYIDRTAEAAVFQNPQARPPNQRGKNAHQE